jgi:hypothetical protein
MRLKCLLSCLCFLLSLVLASCSSEEAPQTQKEFEQQNANSPDIDATKG